MKTASLLTIAGLLVAMISSPVAANGTDNPPGTLVPSLPYTDAGNTTGFNNTYANYGGVCNTNLPFPYPGPDGFYRVSLVAGATYDFSMDLAGSTGDLALFVLSDSASSASCVASSQDAIGPGAGPELIEDFIPATTQEYFVVVDSYYASGGASAGSYNLSINCVAGPCAVASTADLAITKTDGVTEVTAGGSTTYTIVATNNGPSSVSGATVTDTFPAGLTCTWSCAGAPPDPAGIRSRTASRGGSSCTASGTGNILDAAVNLPSGASVTYTAICAIAPGATGTLSNTATIAAPGGTTDPTPGNNSATDTSTIAVIPPGVLTLPQPSVSFGNANLGSTTQRPLTISNTGAGPLQVTAISAVSAPFAQIAGGTCGALPFTLPAGGSCTVLFTFLPTTAGAASQQVTVTAASGTATATLSGTGLLPIQLPVAGGWAAVLLLALFGLGAAVVLRRTHA